MKKFSILVLLAVFSGTVHASELDGVVTQLNDYFKKEHLDRVTAERIGNLVVFSGEVEIVSQIDTVEKLVTGLGTAEPKIAAQNMVKVCPATWTTIAERIEREIGSPEITARIIGRAMFLEGVGESDFEADRAVEIAKVYLGRAKGERTIASAEGNIEIVDMMRVRPRKGVTPAKRAKK